MLISRPISYKKFWNLKKYYIVINVLNSLIEKKDHNASDNEDVPSHLEVFMVLERACSHRTIRIRNDSYCCALEC